MISMFHTLFSKPFLDVFFGVILTNIVVLPDQIAIMAYAYSSDDLTRTMLQSTY